MRDWLLVRLDPPPAPTGSIVVLEENRVLTGEVRAIGPGREGPRGQRLPIVDLKRGERIAFFREHLEHRQGKTLTHRLAELEDGLALLRIDDVLFAVPPEWKGTLG